MARMKRNANGSGCIRLRADGRWEGIYSIPATDGAGKYVRKSVYGKTQEEVRKKLTQITGEIDEGTYVAPSKMKLSEWIDLWLEIYAKPAVKPKTHIAYESVCNNHIKPMIGHIPLKSITTTAIQLFYNKLLEKGNLSCKTIKNIHAILHKALEQAFLAGEIKQNPASRCTLPKSMRHKIEPLDDESIASFLSAIRGHRFENVYYLTLFTGLRKGEVLGLSWDCVDFENNMILINKQLLNYPHSEVSYDLSTTKSGKERYVPVASSVMTMLRKQKIWQEECAKKAGSGWNNEWNLVFTDEIGRHLCHETVYRNFKRIMKSIGMDGVRFHDLRHTYAVASLESGDDIKTIQDNLGHATASFTLDVYGHVNKQMKMKSAQNMQHFIDRVS